MSGTQVRQSIVRSRVWPTEHKQTQVKQEKIASGENVDLWLGGAGGFRAGGEFVDGSGTGGLVGLSSLKLHSTVSATSLHKEIKTRLDYLGTKENDKNIIETTLKYNYKIDKKENPEIKKRIPEKINEINPEKYINSNWLIYLTQEKKMQKKMKIKVIYLL